METFLIERNLFNEEHEMFRRSVRRFVESEVAPNHAAWEEAGVVPRDAWLRAGEAGVLCCTIPEEFGGMGGTFLHSAIVMEELARTGSNGPCFSLHSDIVAPYILHHGNQDLKRKWLPKMATGEVLAAVAMTEPSGGSDLQSIRTSARRDGDEYVINGQKVFISNAQGADFIVVACKTDPEARGKGISLILVETDRPGFSRGRRLKKVGSHAQDLSELFFSDCRVPVSNLIGTENRGFYHLMQELAQERLVQAVRSISSAEAMLSWTIDYTTERNAFGKKVADFQNTQFVLADLYTQIQVNRVFVDRCLALHVEGKFDGTQAAVAKLSAAELQGRVADACLQFFGGWGYMCEMPIARAWVDARSARIAAGSVEIMKTIIAKSILQKTHQVKSKPN